MLIHLKEFDLILAVLLGNVIIQVHQGLIKNLEVSQFNIQGDP